MEALQQATGLSSTVLAHALKPLAAEKGILLHKSSSQDPLKCEVTLPDLSTLTPPDLSFLPSHANANGASAALHSGVWNFTVNKLAFRVKSDV